MIYEYKCIACDNITTLTRPMANRNDEAHCSACGGEASLKISGGTGFRSNFLGSAANPGYMCPVSDTWVDSERKRKQIMKDYNLREHTSADQVKHHGGFF